MQLFAKVLAIPRIETFVDPTVIGSVHDGAWLVEVTLDDRRIGCILDGTARVPAQHARRLEALAYRLPTVPAIAVALPTPDGTPPVLDAWMMRWPDPQEIETGEPAIALAYVEDAGDPDNLTRLCARDELHGVEAVVIVATAASMLVTPAALAALHARMPELRPIVLSADPLAGELRGALAIAGGAYLQLHGEPITPPRSEVAWRDVELAFVPGNEVELVVHADRIDRRAGRLVIARHQLLHASDSVRVDALTPHVDEPAFTVELRAARADLPLACSAFHVARRLAADPVTHAQVAAVVEANRSVAPVCEPFDTALARDRWIDGVVVFDIAGEMRRVRLLPAMRIETPTASIDVRVLRGEVHVRARTGIVLCEGVRLESERVVAAYTTLVIDDIRAAFAVSSALPDEQPVSIIEGQCTRYPHLLSIARPGLAERGSTLELRRRARNDELWCEGSPLELRGTIAKIHPDIDELVDLVRADAADLSWLLEAARGGPLTGRDRVPLVIAERHGISALVVIDLAARTVTLAVRMRAQQTSR